MKNNVYKNKILKAINKLLKSGNIPQTSPQYTRLEKTKSEVKNNNYTHVTKKIINTVDVKKDSKTVKNNIEKIYTIVENDKKFTNSYKPKILDYSKKENRAKTKDGFNKWNEVAKVKLNNGMCRMVPTNKSLDKNDIVAYRNEIQRNLRNAMLYTKFHPSKSTSPGTENLSEDDINNLFVVDVLEIWE